MAPVIVTGKSLTTPRPRFSLFLCWLNSRSSFFSCSSRELQYCGCKTQTCVQYDDVGDWVLQVAEKIYISHFLAIKMVYRILVSSLSCMADLEKLQRGHVSEYRQTTKDLLKKTRQIKRLEEEKHEDAATKPSTDPAKQFHQQAKCSLCLWLLLLSILTRGQRDSWPILERLTQYLAVVGRKLVQQLFDPVSLPKAVHIRHSVLWQAAEVLVHLCGHREDVHTVAVTVTLVFVANVGRNRVQILCYCV